jgi:uncharacterized lipoprotein YajG
MKNIRITLLLSGLLLLGGCATSRSVLDIPTPSTNKPAQLNGKNAYINITSDKRVFEIAPSSPNIPSLDPTEDQSNEIRLRSIARKRNSFGKALGDILLKEGQSVESLTANSIRQAFIEKGYRIVDDKDKTTSSTYVVDTSIEKFWSWMNPGFASITLSTEISTTLAINSANETNKQSVSAKASDHYQTAMEQNWIEVINKVLRAYIDELKNRLE